MRVGLSAGLDPKRKNESDRTCHGLRKPELPALAAQGLEAKKLETGATHAGEARANAKHPADERLRG